MCARSRRSTRLDASAHANFVNCQVPDLVRRARDNFVFLLLAAALFLAYFIYSETGDIYCQENDDSSRPCNFIIQIIYTGVLLVIAIGAIITASFCWKKGANGVRTRPSAHHLVLVGTLLFIIFSISTDLFTSNLGSQSELPHVLASWILHIEVTLVLYTCIRVSTLKLFILGMCNSIIFEFILHYKDTENSVTEKGRFIAAEICLQLVVHLICLKHFRQTKDDLIKSYENVCEVVRANQKYESDMKTTQMLLNSVMPKALADKCVHEFMSTETTMRTIAGDISLQDKVSILFADIVGFTRLSSGLEAARLVNMLNDLFGRFDKLCYSMKCEKVAILGDCYYCVAGCPEPDEDHAYNCVVMGLKICKTIKVFCLENDVALESRSRHKAANPDFEGQIVDMRVGIHSGRVIYAIVGSKRYKFDVYSQDVTWANKLESTGMPGRVHISGCTRGYLKETELQFEDANPSLQYDRPGIVEDWNRLFEETENSNSKVSLKGRFNQLFENHEHPQYGDTTWLVAEPDNFFGNESFNEMNSIADGSTQEVGGSKLALREEDCQVSLLENGERVLPRHTAIAMIHKNTDNQEHHGEQAEEYFHRRGELGGGLMNPLTLAFKNVQKELDNDQFAVVDEDTDYKSRNSLNLERLYRNGFETAPRISEALVEDTFPIDRWCRDIILCMITNLLLFVAVWLSIGYHVAALCVFLVCSVLISVYLVMCRVTKLRYSLDRFMSWPYRHTLGALFLIFPCLPAIVAATQEHCINTQNSSSSIILSTTSHYPPGSHEYLMIILAVCALHSINFSNLSSSIRTTIALVIIIVGFCLSSLYMYCLKQTDYFQWTLALFLLWLLLAFENRAYEVSHRLNFKANIIAKIKRKRVKDQRDFAKQLLNNVIPEHVISCVRDRKHYSKNHEMVGVFFASVVNFNEMYEEQFNSGIEFIRVLSELFSDIDDLLDKTEYKTTIDKIKTTSSTYMGAAGLTFSEEDQDKDDPHPIERMIEFLIDIQKTVEAFSQNMIAFEFKLRIGAHCGEVTAGVMGIEKLLFDIWGNTVNVASRMDSTGMCDKIQITEDLMNQLCLIGNRRNLEKIKFSWVPRGEIFVKGKGMVGTYLLEEETNL